MKLYTMLLLGTIIWFANFINTRETFDAAMTILFTIALFVYSHKKDVMNK
ncbi:MAG: hypothetical protein GY793_06335 [Proteobacteria bacterium]|nr:hypothetical protein [Pseudomonadota bacterium]